MLRSFARFMVPCILALVATASHAQFYKLHNADVTGSGVGQFTRILTNDTANRQQATNSFGGLFTLRDHPVAWAGVELNYGYNRYSQDFSRFGVRTATVQNNVHEATAAYLFHPRFRRFQPFVGVGGGALAFVPVSGTTQWRGTGLLETGFDIPTSNPHSGSGRKAVRCTTGHPTSVIRGFRRKAGLSLSSRLSEPGFAFS